MKKLIEKLEAAQTEIDAEVKNKPTPHLLSAQTRNRLTIVSLQLHLASLEPEKKPEAPAAAAPTK